MMSNNKWIGVKGDPYFLLLQLDDYFYVNYYILFESRERGGSNLPKKSFFSIQFLAKKGPWRPSRDCFVLLSALIWHEMKISWKKATNRDKERLTAPERGVKKEIWQIKLKKKGKRLTEKSRANEKWEVWRKNWIS